MSRKRAITTFLSRKFMITRSSIAFEDFLGSSIAPQVMPPCSGKEQPVLEKWTKSRLSQWLRRLTSWKSHKLINVIHGFSLESGIYSLEHLLLPLMKCIVGTIKHSLTMLKYNPFRFSTTQAGLNNIYACIFTLISWQSCGKVDN